MVNCLDLFALGVCLIAWLGPMLYNGFQGKWHLLHPIGFFPLMIVSMLIAPLAYRLGGEPILNTSRLWSDDEWFLAAPLLILALTGVFYYLGVLLSRTSLRLGPADSVQFCLPLPLLRNVPHTVLAASACTVIGVAVMLQLAKPTERDVLGFYWMNVIFHCFEVIPLLVFHQNRRLGLLCLLLVLPCTILVQSKVAFLMIPLNFLLFYQGKVFSFSKVLTASLVGLVLMTPVAATLYSSDFSQTRDRRDLSGLSAASWRESIEMLAHRDYAFEAFACVCQWRRGGEPLKWGDELARELAQTVPSALWIGQKTVQFYRFPQEYLPYDYRGWATCYARHLLTNFLLDFGIPGCCLGMLFYGFVFGSFYRIARDAAVRSRAIWPLGLNLIWVLQARYFVEGGLPGGLARFFGMLAGVLLLLGLSRLLSAREAPLILPQGTW